MSSRIINGDAARAAEPWRWQVVPSQFGEDPQPLEQASDGPRFQQRVAQLEADMEQRVQQARQAGYRDGEAAGARLAMERTEPVLERLARTIEELLGQRSRLRREAEGELVKLSVAVARRILHRELSTDPEALLGVVHAALEKIDAREIHQLRACPDDAAMIRTFLDRQGLPKRVEVIADPGLEHGGAILETTRGALDLSIETQLHEIERGFTDRVCRR